MLKYKIARLSKLHFVLKLFGMICLQLVCNVNIVELVIFIFNG